MTQRKKGLTQVTAAAQAGFSRRTATRVEGDPLRGVGGPPARRHYRTRNDPFAAVWETELVPLLRREPSLKALTLLGDLQERHPQGFDDRLHAATPSAGMARAARANSDDLFSAGASTRSDADR